MLKSNAGEVTARTPLLSEIFALIKTYRLRPRLSFENNLSDVSPFMF